jgi:hypothetical protein
MARCCCGSIPVTRFADGLRPWAAATPTAAIGDAKASCASNPAVGIPVLEKALKDARIDLQPRG